MAFNYQVIITQPVLVGLKVDDDDFNHTKNFIIQTYFAKKKKPFEEKKHKIPNCKSIVIVNMITYFHNFGCCLELYYY